MVRRHAPKPQWSDPLVRSVVALESYAATGAEATLDDIGADAAACEKEDGGLDLQADPPPQPQPRSPPSSLQPESEDKIMPSDRGQKQRLHTTSVQRKETWSQLEVSALQPGSEMSAAASLDAVLAKREAPPADDSLEAFAYVDQVHPFTLLACMSY